MGKLLLVRHGQASWGAADYDVLSETGWEQSRLLGRSLAARGIAATRVVTGGMRRHAETAKACLEEMGDGGPAPTIDPGWDEFDHVSMLERLPAPFEGRKPDKAEFQEWFEAATVRWTSGDHDDYDESFSAFIDRVGGALRRTTEETGSDTTLVFTSGGPIAAVVAGLLAEEPEVAGRLWRRLNPVCVNSGITRLVTGRRGTTFVAFNEHSHLDGRAGMLSYR